MITFKECKRIPQKYWNGVHLEEEEEEEEEKDDLKFVNARSNNWNEREEN